MPDFANFSGVVPALAVTGDPLPLRTENGIGALMPWAKKLWFVTYSSGDDDGSSDASAGGGLYSLDGDLTMTKHPESVTGTYANRMLHAPTNQVIVGPHIIDIEGNVRTFPGLVSQLLTATCEHLTESESKVLFLTMSGVLFEGDVNTLETRVLFRLVDELGLPDKETWHFKGAHTGQGRVVIANNSYDDRDFRGELKQGRLAQWDGTTWEVVEEIAYSEVSGRRNWDELIFATSWDRRSAVLSVCADGTWKRYRLPKASHTWDHYWQTEWPRIREIESERYLMDCHAMFYELSPVPWAGGKIWGVRPISTHLRIIPDYCAWRGMLVLGGNQQTPIWDTNLAVGDAESNLWFGKSDDLWNFGKPAGWGGPWWKDDVVAGEPSDPFLMTGFDKKVLHLTHTGPDTVEFTVEVDFLGDESWAVYETFAVPGGGYIHHEFPSGFSAHWVRVTLDTAANATAYFTYT